MDSGFVLGPLTKGLLDQLTRDNCTSKCQIIMNSAHTYIHVGDFEGIRVD